MTHRALCLLAPLSLFLALSCVFLLLLLLQGSRVEVKIKRRGTWGMEELTVTLERKALPKGNSGPKQPLPE